MNGLVLIKRVGRCVFIAVLLLIGWVIIGLTHGEETDRTALYHETQKLSRKGDDMAMVWWIPDEFWEPSSPEDALSQEAIQEIVRILRPYTIVVALAGEIEPDRRITYKPEARIRATIRLKDNEGTVYLPLPPNKVNADAKDIMAEWKPVFVNIIGPMGENLHLFFFPAKKKNGQDICDAKEKGAFSVELGEHKFRWRLPLASVLPPEICPHCAEKCSGAWNFCPWCGTKLPE